MEKHLNGVGVFFNAFIFGGRRWGKDSILA